MFAFEESFQGLLEGLELGDFGGGGGRLSKNGAEGLFLGEKKGTIHFQTIGRLTVILNLQHDWKLPTSEAELLWGLCGSISQYLGWNIVKTSNHLNLLLNFHRNTKLSTRQSRPIAMSRAILSQMPVLKLSWEMGLFLSRTSFCKAAEKPYLTGDRYWIQPSHRGILSKFLQQPAKRRVGCIKSGVSALTVLLSLAILPSMRPRDEPAKEVSMPTRQKVKNWGAVGESAVRKQKMRPWQRGKNKVQGIQMRLLLRKQVRGPQSLAWRSLMKTKRSEGKVTEICVKERRSMPMGKRKRMPTTAFQSAGDSQLPPRWQQSPAVNRLRKVARKNLSLISSGFLKRLVRSLQSRILMAGQVSSSPSLLARESLRWALICWSTAGRRSRLQVEQQAGKEVRQVLASTMERRQSAGLQNWGQVSANCQEKQCTAAAQGPWQTGCPSASSSRVSKSEKISALGWWMLRMMVLLSLSASCLKYSTMMQEVNESRPEVGSSRISTAGSVMSSQAMEVRLRSPPETPLTMLPPTTTSRHFQSLSFLAQNSTRLIFSASGTLSRRSAANLRVSLTVRVWMRMSSCITQLPKSPKCYQLKGRPLTLMVPLRRSLGTLPARIFSRLVFPQPEGPIIAEIWPALKMPEIRLRIGFAFYFYEEGKQKGLEFCQGSVQKEMSWNAMSTQGFQAVSLNYWQVFIIFIILCSGGLEIKRMGVKREVVG